MHTRAALRRSLEELRDEHQGSESRRATAALGSAVSGDTAILAARDGRGRQSCNCWRLNMAEEKGSSSGLSEAEAKEFHRIFVTSFVVFTLIAVVAHFLVWQWRPWL